MTVGRAILGVLGAVLVVVTFRDVIITVVTTRRDRRFSFGRLYVVGTWTAYATLARRISDPARRERFLVPFGPVSLVGLLVAWVTLLVLGWGLVWWGLQSHLEGIDSVVSGIYFSGVTFLTVGYGDIVPAGDGSRMLVMVEALMGILTTALVIGFLPILFGAYSRREARLLTLDDLEDQITARGFLQRYARGGDLAPLFEEFRSWEGWCADVYDSHTAYPMLLTFRSRQPGRSWSVGLGVVLEAVSNVLAVVDRSDLGPAESLYRRAVMVLDTVRRHRRVTVPGMPVPAEEVERRFRSVYDAFVADGLPVRPLDEARDRLHALRADYLPVLLGLSEAMLAPLEFRPNVRPLPVSGHPSDAVS